MIRKYNSYVSPTEKTLRKLIISLAGKDCHRNKMFQKKIRNIFRVWEIVFASKTNVTCAGKKGIFAFLFFLFCFFLTKLICGFVMLV